MLTANACTLKSAISISIPTPTNAVPIAFLYQTLYLNCFPRALASTPAATSPTQTYPPSLLGLFPRSCVEAPALGLNHFRGIEHKKHPWTCTCCIRIRHGHTPHSNPQLKHGSFSPHIQPSFPYPMCIYVF